MPKSDMTLTWTADQFKQVLNKVELNSRDREILQAFLDAPGQTLTARGLARQAKLNRGGTATLRLQAVARKFRQVLGDPKTIREFDPQWWRYVATGEWRENYLHWTLLPELQEALLAVGWTPKPGQ